MYFKIKLNEIYRIINYYNRLNYTKLCYVYETVSSLLQTNLGVGFQSTVQKALNNIMR